MQQNKKSSKMAVEKQLSCTEELRLPPYIFLETLGKFARDALASRAGTHGQHWW